ncbi:hypothetical protein BJ138DRAFT_1108154 [Hygrophoropsis aurantiaca]|uniref:Uncharacterized protein n=1 Tax=Hygrophoropsis aurantiaca TaxID=72124 RepID=A0ACB7ZRB1_9AGAM|nr:hypothetical protein BJ138DRAFT_1108154 [Hygrophoropsis aurantiaca]
MNLGDAKVELGEAQLGCKLQAAARLRHLYGRQALCATIKGLEEIRFPPTIRLKISVDRRHEGKIRSMAWTLVRTPQPGMELEFPGAPHQLLALIQLPKHTVLIYTWTIKPSANPINHMLAVTGGAHTCVWYDGIMSGPAWRRRARGEGARGGRAGRAGARPWLFKQHLFDAQRSASVRTSGRTNSRGLGVEQERVGRCGQQSAIETGCGHATEGCIQKVWRDQGETEQDQLAQPAT